MTERAGAPAAGGAAVRPRPTAARTPSGAADRAVRATLVVWLLDPPLGWPLAVPALALASLGLLQPRPGRSRWVWAGLSAVALARIGLDWMLADNHHFLMAWWCIALWLALGDADPDEAVRVQSRRLLGLAFAFAVLWKAVLSPDYLDGRFFRVTLLFDGRFEALGTWFGLDASAIAHNDAWLHAFDARAGAGGAAPGPVEPEALRLAAKAATAWTLAIEAAVALAFLWPGAGGPARWRDAVLLVFGATTYAVAPVPGFGWLLVALGFSQCDPDRRLARAGYLGLLVLILVHARVPWLDALAGLAPGSAAGP